MLRSVISRRQFGRVSATLGAAILADRLAASVAAASPPASVPADAIQINSNENPYGPPARALQAMTESQAVASRYPEAKVVELIEQLAKLHRVGTENIILGCGSSEVLRFADMAFLTPEKSVVVAEPTYEAVLGYARVTRARPVRVPLTPDFCHDLPAMAAACDTNTGLVYVCNPNNPTGTIVTRDELAAFIPKVPRSTAIVVDEAYFHLVEDARYASALEWLGKTPNLIVVYTFSKIYGMAGMRLGYAVASAENIRAMRDHQLRFNTNAAVVAAALACLVDAEHVPVFRRRLNDTRRWLCRELEKDGRRYIPSETNFVMIHVGSDVRPVIAEFAKRNILVGRKFPSLGEWLRVSIGTPKEMETFVQHLREILPARAGKPA